MGGGGGGGPLFGSGSVIAEGGGKPLWDVLMAYDEGPGSWGGSDVGLGEYRRVVEDEEGGE